MKFVVGSLGIGQMAYAYFVFTAASTSSHEIYGATLLGAGTICFGIAGVIDAIERL